MNVPIIELNGLMNDIGYSTDKYGISSQMTNPVAVIKKNKVTNVILNNEPL